jgi:flagellar biosynthesis/type III secretory pathway M-ring protein FliF/YscJ
MRQVEISLGPIERYIRDFNRFYNSLNQNQKIAFYAAILGIILIIAAVIMW